jgi:hypothetical protein
VESVDGLWSLLRGGPRSSRGSESLAVWLTLRDRRGDAVGSKQRLAVLSSHERRSVSRSKSRTRGRSRSSSSGRRGGSSDDSDGRDLGSIRVSVPRFAQRDGRLSLSFVGGSRGDERRGDGDDRRSDRVGVTWSDDGVVGRCDIAVEDAIELGSGGRDHDRSGRRRGREGARWFDVESSERGPRDGARDTERGRGRHRDAEPAAGILLRFSVSESSARERRRRDSGDSGSDSASDSGASHELRTALRRLRRRFAEQPGALHSLSSSLSAVAAGPHSAHRQLPPGHVTVSDVGKALRAADVDVALGTLKAIVRYVRSRTRQGIAACVV